MRWRVQGFECRALKSASMYLVVNGSRRIYRVAYER